MPTKIPAHIIHTGHVVQVAYVTVPTLFTTSANIPLNNTVPTSSGGAELMTVSITPKASSNLLFVDVGVIAIPPSGGGDKDSTVALFKDAESSARAVSVGGGTTSGAVNWAGSTNHKILYRMTAGTTSAITFRVRVGGQAGNLYINAWQGGGQQGGGVMSTYMKVEEVAA